MLAQALMTASAGILLTLGLLHLAFTLRGPRLTPRDPALRLAMERDSPVLTRQTTMWRAWIGFNASHSLGAILFGAVYGDLALAHPGWLFGDPVLAGAGLLMTGGYVVIGRNCWFSVPFRASLIAFACYAAALAIAARGTGA